MQLKRLVLTGFKTFAGRASLEFSAGITAIVGPNGSGKSNLADAIQWVLGERSSKAVRAHRPADVIFAGNAERKPLSVAEVTLVLDNEDESLSIPFSEVSITRRIYRSGECDYFLNKTPCRLRDIYDLLLDTGLGSDSFAIINQIQIDAILSLHPEDRRALFEQVAGTQRYQVRRAQAVRKLEKTERNLTRVRDILHELEAQLPPLAEQAEVARRYDELMRRLRELQLGLLGWEHLVRQRRMQRLHEERSTLEEKLSQIRGELELLQNERRDLEAELSVMEEKLAELQTKSTEAVSKAKSIEGEVALAKQELAHLSQRLRRVEEEIRLLSEREAALAAQEEEMATRLLALEEKAKEAGKTTEAVQGQLQTLEEQWQSLNQSLEDAKDEHVEMVRQQAKLRNQITEYDRVIAGLETRLKDLGEEEQKAILQLNQSQQRREKLEQQVIALEEQRQQLQGESEQVKKEQVKLEAESEALRRQAGGVRELLSGLKSRLNVLEEVEVSLSGVHQGARAVLLAARSGELKSEYHLIAHLLRVAQEYERAVEVALGAALQYVVADTAEQVHEAIGYLKRKRGGRATFLALDFLRPRSFVRPVFGGEEGFIGWLNELVSIEERFRVVLEYLGAHIAVVGTLEQASALGRRLGSVFRVVTLEGELVVPGGAISGGIEPKSQPSLLARRREMEELKNLVRATEIKVLRLEEELRQKGSLRSERQKAMEQIGSKLEGCVWQLNRLVAEKESHDQQRQRWEDEVQQLRAETTHVLKELENLRKEKAVMQSNLEGVEAQTLNLEGRTVQIQQQLQGVQRQREALLQELANYRSQQAQVVEKLTSAQSERDSHRRQRQEMAQALQARSQEKAQIQDELARLESAVPELERQREGLELVRQEAESAFQDWRVHRRALAQRIEELEGRIQQTQERIRQQEEELHKLEIRRTQTVTEQEELERRLKEELQAEPHQAHEAAERIEQKQSAQEELSSLKSRIQAMGVVNIGAIEEYERVKQRVDFLQEQKADLESGKANLEQIISQIDQDTRSQFLQSLEQVEREFGYLFTRVFGGGKVSLALTKPDNFLETGVDVRVQLPGKAEQDIVALSGGERAMTAVCLVFAMLRVKPAPFCILDEVDAPLDEANIEKFVSLLQEFAKQSQFIVITHNYGTLQGADNIYGVTMQEEGVSQILSLSPDTAKPQVQESAALSG